MTIKTFIALLFLINAGKIFANAAQPGIWNAGGMGNFSLLFPDDSLSYKKIQMTDELVSILLFKGYAVVKGEYRMYNETKDTITIRTGYPLNTNFNSETKGSYRNEIRFDSLYGLKVIVNSHPVQFVSVPSDGKKEYSKNDNWYVWNNTFPPGDTTLITVYFIVNTNDNIVRKGYTKDHYNGFIYVLETGATWKQPILNGELRIKMEDELNTEDIKGVRPDTVFMVNEKIMQYKFWNISPAYNDNIIITYSEKAEGLDFENILSGREMLFKKADDFSKIQIDEGKLAWKKFGSPYETDSADWLSAIFILSVIGIPVLIIIVLAAVIVYIIVRLYKKSKKQKLIRETH